jgi:hypothetical protein
MICVACFKIIGERQTHSCTTFCIEVEPAQFGLDEYWDNLSINIDWTGVEDVR